jgi:hypothetical protein
MTQLERLLARVVQVVEDSPGQMVTLVITIGAVGVPPRGVPVCWQVNQTQAEGLQVDCGKPTLPNKNSV